MQDYMIKKFHNTLIINKEDRQSCLFWLCLSAQNKINIHSLSIKKRRGPGNFPALKISGTWWPIFGFGRSFSEKLFSNRPHLDPSHFSEYFRPPFESASQFLLAGWEEVQGFTDRTICNICTQILIILNYMFRWYLLRYI